MPVDEWGWSNSDARGEENARLEANIQELISNIPIDCVPVMRADDYINFDDFLQTEEVVINEKAIIKEILQSSGSKDDADSDVEVEKIPHAVVLEQCKLLLQYVEQQDPVTFVQEPDLPRLQSLLRRIQGETTKTKQQKQLTDFF